MNLTDLRDVLDERSAPDNGNVLAHLMLSGVHQRLAARRRRRRAAAVAAAVVAVAAVGLAASALPRLDTRTPVAALPDAAPVRTIEGFPEYASGARVVAASAAQTPARSTSVTFTPTTLDLVLFTRCTERGKHAIVIGGVSLFQTEGGCGTYGTGSGALGKKHGATIGRPLTITLSFTTATSAEFGLAVGERVDASAYRFPPRPTVLNPLRTEKAAGPILTSRGGVVRADPADPNRPMSVTFPWNGLRSTSMVAQTPGELSLRLNGKELSRGEWWDYQQGEITDGGVDGEDLTLDRGLGLRTGQQVTLEVSPRRMTGDWAVEFESML